MKLSHKCKSDLCEAVVDKKKSIMNEIIEDINDQISVLKEKVRKKQLAESNN